MFDGAVQERNRQCSRYEVVPATDFWQSGCYGFHTMNRFTAGVPLASTKPEMFPVFKAIAYLHVHSINLTPASHSCARAAEINERRPRIMFTQRDSSERLR
jgi:hypothetical protein